MDDEQTHIVTKVSNDSKLRTCIVNSVLTFDGIPLIYCFEHSKAVVMRRGVAARGIHELTDTPLFLYRLIFAGIIVSGGSPCILYIDIEKNRKLVLPIKWLI